MNRIVIAVPDPIWTGSFRVVAFAKGWREGLLVSRAFRRAGIEVTLV